MNKTKIFLHIILPEVPDAKDECVTRIIEILEQKRGIEKVHIVTNKETDAQLCFHYDPNLISISAVEKFAQQAGAEVTKRYGHLLLDVTGIRHTRHARVVESQIKGIKGIISVSASASGKIHLEFDRTVSEDNTIIQKLNKIGIKVNSVENFHEHNEDHEHQQPAAAEKNTDHAHDHDKEGHDHKDHEGHDHKHGGIFGEKTEIIFAVLSGLLLGSGFGLSFISGIPAFVPTALYIGAYFFGGFFTTKEAIEGISKGEFEIDFLMLVAAVGAAVLGQWAEGALLLFLFSLGHSLEHYAMEKARKSIAALADLAPKTALLKDGDQIKEVQIDQLKAGDVIVIKSNSKIAADGVVIKGNSSVNQAPITGESVPVDKAPIDEKSIDLAKFDGLDAQYRVFAGSINGGETLEIKVAKVAKDSTISRLINLVNEAQTQKSPTQNFTDKLEKYYVPAVLILVGALMLAFLVIDEPFSKSFYRAMAVLVAASPCALAISTPSAVLSGVARAARGGVLVKGGKPLEELGSLTAIAFDKTGTLTEGKPKLTGIYPQGGTTEEDLLTVVIAVEKLSDHPLAAAIVKGGMEKLKQDVSAASNVEAIMGRGVKASHDGKTIYVGNKQLFQEKQDQIPDDLKGKIEELENKGNTTMLVQRNGAFIGVITLMDVARKDAQDTLNKLQNLGIRQMIMLTGDNQRVADAIAKSIGITRALGDLLPEQKVQAIEKLRTEEKQVAMVGDGVNDAPAMAKSTVGIAMGAAGSDVALETADIALMADQLSNLPFAIGLSRKARAIIRQNLVISLGMVAVLIPLTILGIAHIGPAVIGHEGSTLVVVFNALRLLAYKK